jgi:hypothetical protein
MHDYTVARSMCLSPIMSALHENGINFDEMAFLSGIPKERIVNIGMGVGAEASIEEVARLASLVGMELSVVPQAAAINAFTEPTVHRVERSLMASYARRVVSMTDKVVELCIDLRLATELPSGTFEREYGIDDRFMSRMADIEQSAAANLHEMFSYLKAFGATLVSFPAKSEFNNYYRAMMATKREPANVRTAPSLKVA